MTSWPPLHAATQALAVSPSQAAGEILRRRAARTGMLAFTQYTNPAYDASWHHRLLCAKLDALARGEVRRLIVCMPPQHGKSELVSRRLPAYLLGKNPHEKIIACSHTSGLASDMNRDVQRIIDDDPYRRLYPGTRLSDRNVRTLAGPMPLRNSEVFELVGASGYYRSAGVGTAIVGRGFTVGIIDDPMAGREAADSPTQRENVWKWYTGDFYTRRAGDARILLVSTRWHPEDLVGRLMAQQEADPKADRWELINLPAICEAQKHPDDPRQPGEALWPARYPVEELDRTRAANPYDWWSQYQGKPRAPGSVEWPDEMFDGPGFWFDDWPDNCQVTVVSLDPSKGSDAKAGDYQAIVRFGRTPDETEWVEADIARRPMVAPRAADDTAIGEGMVERAVEVYDQAGAELLAVETNAFQQLLLIPLRQEAKRQKVELRIKEMDNRTNKAVRIRRLGDPLSRRRMRFRRTHGTRILVEQLKQFPVADHDDGPDALEMARRAAIALWNGPRARKQPGRMMP